MNRDLVGIWFFTMFGSLLLTVVFSLEIDAQAEGPTIYDYNGTWVIFQTGTSPITMEIQQNGNEITGKASYDAGRKGIARGTVQGRAWSGQSGWLIGTIRDFFEVEITWHGGVGVYSAKSWLDTGQLVGGTWPKGNPAGKVDWKTDEVFPKLPLRPKPIKSSGKAKSEPAPPPPKPPFITSGQVTIVQPSLPFASVYLGWDGGPDHPHAEVWVSIDNGDQIPAFDGLQNPAFKLAKVAAIDLKLQRGRLYKFFLKDAGTTLSTVLLTVP